jgi:plasmid stability protein
MKHLQVKNIPEELHAQLRAIADREGCSIRDLVLEAVRQRVARDAFLSRLGDREPVDIGVPAAALVREARAEYGGSDEE